MSETGSLIEITASKLLAPLAEPVVQREAEERGIAVTAWQAIAESGLGGIFGASDDPWRDAAVVLKACGRHPVAAPLAETVMAGAGLVLAGLEPPAGLVALSASEGLQVSSGCVSGTLRHVPWGSRAEHVVAEVAGSIVLLRSGDASATPDRSISREPRDTLVFDGVRPIGETPTRHSLKSLGALMRAAQMAGCIEAVLEMTVRYARERSQFGKPIGSFQAIQHQLAILAGHAASSSRAVDAAFDRIAVAGGDPEIVAYEAAIARIRTSEAAGVAASIAHQTHGAMGFTDEHSLHYFTRRLWTWRSEFGTEADWSAWLGRRIAKAGAGGFWPGVTAAG